jgi:diaminopimelate decarboxylase
MDLFTPRDGRLFCEEVPLDTIAGEYGTPTYVYSRGTLASHFTRLNQALDELEHTICYAIKANGNLAVLACMAELGAGFDIVSGGELYRVIAAGGDPRKAVFAGVGKTADEIRFAIDNEVLFFTVESEEELQRINAIAQDAGKTARYSVRVNPDVDACTHHYITTGKSENKFGLSFDAARALYARATALPAVKAVGVHMHIGSQIVTTDPFVAAINRLSGLVQELRADGVEVEYIDIGGGMGIIYKDEQPPTPDRFAAAVVPLLKELDAQVLFEPGRFLVGNAGVLLTTVQYVKRTATKTFVIVDAGMNDLIRPALYEAYHEILPVNARSGDMTAVDVVGPICESGDFLALDRVLPPVSAGDCLAVRSAGAYGFVMSSNYNSRPRAAEVMVDGCTARLVRRRESWQDLVAPECPCLDSEQSSVNA